MRNVCIGVTSPLVIEIPGEASVRVLDLAERIGTLVEARVWTRTTFPTATNASRRLKASPGDITAAFDVLVKRGVLRRYLDRDISPRPRHLPADGAENHIFDLNSIKTVIRANVVSNVWTPENFPTLRQLARHFRCRPTTVSTALRELETEGVVRTVKVMRTWRWVPMSHPGFSRPPLHHTFADDIRAGTWTGPLPDVVDLARRYHVHRAKMLAALQTSERQGLLRYVWLPDFTRRAWYVIDSRAPRWLPPGRGTKAAAIAADLVRRLPEWLTLAPDGSVLERRPLPAVTHLRKHYHCHHTVMKNALTALVLRGVLEHVDQPQQEYSPLRIPAHRFPEGIPAASHRAGVARRRRRLPVCLSQFGGTTAKVS